MSLNVLNKSHHTANKKEAQNLSHSAVGHVDDSFVDYDRLSHLKQQEVMCVVDGCKQATAALKNTIYHQSKTIEDKKLITDYPPEIEQLMQKYSKNKDEICKIRTDLVYYYNFSSLDGGQLSGEIMLIVAKKDPRLVLDHFDKYSHQPYAQDILKQAVIDAVKDYPGLVLDHFDKYSHQPYAQDILKQAVTNAAKNHPKVALEYFDKYSHQSYAQDILKQAVTNAAKNHPKVALEYFDKYSHQSYAQDILKQAVTSAAKNDPRLVLDHFDKYSHQPYAQDALQQVAEHDSFVLFLYFDTYSNQPYAQDILKQVATNAAKHHPQAALTYFDKYSNQPYAQDILKQAVTNTAKDDPGVVLGYFDKYSDQSYAQGTLKQAIKKDPGAVLKYFDKYSDQSYAQDVLKQAVTNAAKKDPGAVLKYFDKYSHQPYTQDILKQAVTNAGKDHPQAVLKYFDTYSDQSYAQDILKQAIKKDSGAALQYFDKYSDQPYAQDILKQAAIYAAKNDPGAALQYFDKYSDQSYVEEVVNSISLPEFLFLRGKLPRHELFDGVRGLFASMYEHVTNVVWAHKKIPLTEEMINIYSGILKTYLANKDRYTKNNGQIDWSGVQSRYESNVASFVEQGKNRSEKNSKNIHVTYIRASRKNGDDYNDALHIMNSNMLSYYTNLGGASFENYEKNPASPGHILDVFEQSIEDSPHEYHLFHLGAHGGMDGSVELVGGDRSKEDFTRLFSIAKGNPRIRIDITSCNSGTKGYYKYNAIKNISMDSGNQGSFGGPHGTDAIFLRAFTKKDKDGLLVADYDGDGVVNFNEALLYRAMSYSRSLTPIMMDDGKGNGIDIALVGGCVQQDHVG